jgi:hypothetical protein
MIYISFYWFILPIVLLWFILYKKTDKFYNFYNANLFQVIILSLLGMGTFVYIIIALKHLVEFLSNFIKITF